MMVRRVYIGFWQGSIHVHIKWCKNQKNTQGPSQARNGLMRHATSVVIWMGTIHEKKKKKKTKQKKDYVIFYIQIS